MYQFKRDHPIDARIKESSKINLKYPTRAPIIVEKAETCELCNIDKNKYLVPKDMNFGQFIFIIRKRIHLNPSQSLFVMVNNQLVSSSSSIMEIHEKYKDEDGFVYMKYTSENTFG